jgi:hypothetical protein
VVWRPASIAGHAISLLMRWFVVAAWAVAKVVKKLMRIAVKNGFI